MENSTTTATKQEQDKEQVVKQNDVAKSKMSVQIRKLEKLEATGGRLDHGDS